MNKRGGGIFDIIMVLLVMVGIVTVLFLLLNLVGESVDEKFTPLCTESCENYDMDFFKVVSGGPYQSIECWCLDDDDLPRQVPIEIITNDDDDSWSSKFWNTAKKLWGRN